MKKNFSFRKDISDLKLYFNEMTLLVFNKNNLDSQQRLMDILSNPSLLFSEKNSGLFRKINNFLIYMQKFERIEGSCVKIIGDDELKLVNMFEEMPIQLNFHATKICFRSSIFSVKEFTLLANRFDEFRMELDYPQPSFDEIYNIAMKIKNSNSSKYKISIAYSGVKCTDTYFRFNKNISYLTIDESVNEISSDDNKGSFEYCSSLVQVIIPNSINVIKNYAFGSCSSLTKISIPSGVKTIPNGCFNLCEKLLDVSIPSSLENISYHAFYGCSSLTKICIPSIYWSRCLL